MSDFVSNLIGRHTQTEGNVTPRVRGRFESERSHAGFAPDEPGAGPNWTESKPLFNRPSREPQNIDSQYVNQQRPADRDLFSSDRPVVSNPFSRGERDGAINPKPQPERAERATHDLPGNNLFNPVKSRRNEEMPEPVRQGRRDEQLSDNQWIVPVKTVLKSPISPENKAFTTRSSGLLGEPNRLPEFRQNSAENRSEPVPATPAQPSIKVTIGRIDVRAMPSPSPAPTTAKSAPKPQLSLDDYLKQRNNRPT